MPPEMTATLTELAELKQLAHTLIERIAGVEATIATKAPTSATIRQKPKKIWFKDGSPHHHFSEAGRRHCSRRLLLLWTNEEIAQEMGVTNAAISRHRAVLEEAGLLPKDSWKRARAARLKREALSN